MIPEKKEQPLLLKPAEAASLLAISPRTLWSITNSGKLPCIKMGRAVRYDRKDLVVWIERQKNNQIRSN